MKRSISSLYFALFLSVLFLITGCEMAKGPTAPKEPLLQKSTSQAFQMTSGVFEAEAILSPPVPSVVGVGDTISASVDFGMSFSSIEQLCFIFQFQDALLDPGEHLDFGPIGPNVFGFTNVLPNPQNTRINCLIKSSHPENISVFLDGQEDFGIQMTIGSVIIGSLKVQITGVQILPSEPDIAVSAEELDFGNLEVGKELDLPLIVTNEGKADLDVSATNLTGADADQWEVTNEAAPFTLKPGESQEVIVCFNPTSSGTKNGTLEILSNDPDEDPVKVTLKGTGEVVDAPDIAAAPTKVDFRQVDVGSSKDKTFVLKNDGTTDLKINKKQVAGSNAEQYEVLDLDVPAVLAPGESRDVTVRFSPTSSGIKKGHVKLFSNDPDENPFSVSFKGTGIGDDDDGDDDGDGVPDISAAPTRVDFGQVAVGSSKDKTFVLKNDGTADLEINKKQVAGSNAEQYEIVDLDVPAVLAPGESREVTVRFSPTSSGIKKGHVKLFSNDPNENPFSVSFKGTGIGGTPDIAAAPTRVDFGKVDVGSSKDKTFVLKNDGTGDLKIEKKQVAGSNAEQYEVLDLDVPVVLAPGESREVTVRFSPTSSGIKKGHVKLFSNDPDENPFPVSFKGTGIDDL